MRKLCWLTALALALAGCASEEEVRLREYSTDGLRLFEHGAYPEARQTFEAALSLKPADPALLFNIGQCHERQGEMAQAEHCYQLCLQQEPNHIACRHALLALWAGGQRWREANAMVEDWIRREPERAAPLAEAGWLARRAGDQPRAQQLLQQALELDPNDPRALIELAMIYEERKRPERAISLYERYLEHHPGREEVWKRLESLRAAGGTG